MADFYKLDIRQLPKTSQLSAEDRYWKQFKNSQTHKHFVKVTDIQFSPQQSHDIAVAASTRLTIYDPFSLEATKTITRFKDVCLSCSYRRDGRLISASSNDGLIQVFDVNSRMILRTLKGHQGSIWGLCHSDNFSWLFSSGDDRIIRKWDLTSEQIISSYQQHSDYVRIVKEWNENVIISGSYDGTVKYWDTRIKEDESCIGTLTHGAPVSALLILPTTTATSAAYQLITAGDVYMKAWDTRSLSTSSTSSTSQSSLASIPLHTISNHQKTITSLSLDSTQTRILSSSLDSFIKVTSLTSFTVVSSIKFAAPLLTAGVSPDNTILAAGHVDGTLILRKREKSIDSDSSQRESLIRLGSAAWFNRGSNSIPAADDYRIVSMRKIHLKPYDAYLKKFQYHQALDAALKTNKAIIITSLLDELLDRQGLYIAINGRTDLTLMPLLSFLLLYISHPYYSTLLLDVINVVLTIYGEYVGSSIIMDEWITKIREKVRQELVIQQLSMKMIGGMEMIWRGTTTFNQQQQASAAISEEQYQQETNKPSWTTHLIDDVAEQLDELDDANTIAAKVAPRTSKNVYDEDAGISTTDPIVGEIDKRRKKSKKKKKHRDVDNEQHPLGLPLSTDDVDILALQKKKQKV